MINNQISRFEKKITMYILGGKGDSSEVDSEEDSEDISDDDEIKKLKLQTGELSVADVLHEACNRQNEKKLTVNQLNL